MRMESKNSGSAWFVLRLGLAVSAGRMVVWAGVGLTVLLWPEGDMMLLADVPTLGVCFALSCLGLLGNWTHVVNYWDLRFLAVGQLLYFVLGCLAGGVILAGRRAKADAVVGPADSD